MSASQTKINRPPLKVQKKQGLKRFKNLLKCILNTPFFYKKKSMEQVWTPSFMEISIFFLTLPYI